MLDVLFAAWIVVVSCATATADVRLFPVCAKTTEHNDFLYLLGQAIPDAKLVLPCDFQDVAEALGKVPENASIVVLAQNTPVQITDNDISVAREKGIRIFAEFAYLEGGNATISTTHWERAVVSPDENRDVDLEALQILNTHVVNYTKIDIDPKDIVSLYLAKVAGYDVAVYGLPKNSLANIPLLVRKSNDDDDDDVLMISSIEMSNFVTNRFAPKESWGKVWKLITRFLRVSDAGVDLQWSSAVRPTYDADDTLPDDAEFTALARGVDWYLEGVLLPGPQLTMELARMRAATSDGVLDPQLLSANRSMGGGNGIVGVLEGYNSQILNEGRQLTSCNIRDDCTAETAMSFAMRASNSGWSKYDNETDYARVATNLLNYAWMRGGYVRQFMPGVVDPLSDSWGLLAWSSTKYASQEFYTDDDARALLAGLAARSLLGDRRWDATLAGAILANLRMAGVSGFSAASNTFASVEKSTWQKIHSTNYSSKMQSFSPHYQSYIWAVFLRAFDLTGYAPLYDHAYEAIRTMMRQYPSSWQPTANGIAMQRARMILPLAWLVRVRDTAESRNWLDTIVRGLLERQDPSTGALREEISAAGWGGSARTPNNADYGTFEAPLNQNNSDPVSDLLYTSNFAFIGLHEAWKATGKYKENVDKLADFLVRIQACSTCSEDDRSRPKQWLHPELDGGYFRAFDYVKWEVWASDADLGWGAWSMETGWTQSWITATFGLRLKDTSLWDLSGSYSQSSLREEILQLVPYYFPSSS